MAEATSMPDSGGEVCYAALDSGYPLVCHGTPFPQACSRHVDETFRAQRVYVVASGSLSRNTDYVQQLQRALGNKVVGVRKGMTPHSLWSEILEIVHDARATNADLLVTLGAGSLTDAAKIVALALANNVTACDNLERLHSGDDWAKPRPDLSAPTVPIISIPTSLSGGEYSNLGGGTNDKTRQKHGFLGPSKGPALVILDPQLTTTTPDGIWLSTGIRAVDHCVEAICSLTNTTSQSDADAAKGLRLLVPGLLRCKHNKQDLEARFNCQMGVIEAIKAVFQHQVPLGASHGIGHQLGPLGVGHGETSCILLPAVMRYNASANSERQQLVLDVLWSLNEVVQVLKSHGLTRQADLGDCLNAVISALGMPRSLKDVGVGEDHFGTLAKNALHDKWCHTNPRPLEKEEQVMEILQMVKR